MARVFPSDKDTVMSMLFYRVLGGGASRYAQTYWEGSYTRLLYPSASVESQRVSEFYKRIGDESYHRDFFKAYIAHIRSEVGSGVLVDSSGCHCPLRFRANPRCVDRINSGNSGLFISVQLSLFDVSKSFRKAHSRSARQALVGRRILLSYRSTSGCCLCSACFCLFSASVRFLSNSSGLSSASRAYSRISFRTIAWTAV